MDEQTSDNYYSSRNGYQLKMNSIHVGISNERDLISD